MVLLAAGASSRMRGADKLLEPVGDLPLIAAQARKALEAIRRGIVAYSGV